MVAGERCPVHGDPTPDQMSHGPATSGCQKRAETYPASAGARGWKNEAVFKRLDQANAAILELNSLSDADLFTLLKGADALLFPSIAEGFGLPPAEAAWLGTPVLCADLPVYREFLGDIPVYLDVNDGYLWKKAVETLLNREANKSNRPKTSDPLSLPTWTEHFNIVLRVA